MEIINNPDRIHQISKRLLCSGGSIGMVPTMGALHEGHLSLVRRCIDQNGTTVVSLFVNPAQFGPAEDLERYPSDPEGDSRKLEELGVDILFMPDVESIYPDGFSTRIILGGITDKLCGAFRPGHFSGVATVVMKLFNIVRPSRAYFGQKDYQQTMVIKRAAEDLNIDTETIACPTVREDDGLAMSSRNLYLAEEERAAATIIYKTLIWAEERLRSGSSPAEVKSFMHKTLISEPLVSEVQYASLYNSATLDDLSPADATIENSKTLLLAVAVIIGGTRLIDNCLVDLGDSDKC